MSSSPIIWHLAHILNWSVDKVTDDRGLGFRECMNQQASTATASVAAVDSGLKVSQGESMYVLRVYVPYHVSMYHQNSRYYVIG